MSDSSIPDKTPRYPIGVVARRTGLKPDLIRAWERRYSAVEPGRSDTRRRFYSDADVERLLLLRRVVNTGHGIGQVANLKNRQLEELIEADPAPQAAARQTPAGGTAESTQSDDVAAIAEHYLHLCLGAAQRLEVGDLERHIERASVALSRIHVLEKLLVPLMHRIGDLWHQGELRPIHEHMASAVVRSFLGGMRGIYHVDSTAPHLVVTTPARQHHELGALIAAATAAGEGWQVTYLGPDLPPEEIAAAAAQKGARAIALSITYPPDDPALVDDLKRLRRLLGPQTSMIVGGRCAPSYTAALDEIGAHQVDSLTSLRQRLEALRASRQ